MLSSVISCSALGAAGGPLIKSTTGITDAGVVYYLPKQLVKIEITRTTAPHDLTDNLAKTKDAACQSDRRYSCTTASAPNQ